MKVNIFNIFISLKDVDLFCQFVKSLIRIIMRDVWNILFACGLGMEKKSYQFDAVNKINQSNSAFSYSCSALGLPPVSSLQLFSGGSHEHAVNGKLPLAPGFPASNLKVHNILVVEIKCLFSDQNSKQQNFGP